MKQVLITGGLGYIGKHIISELQNNYQFIVLDNLSNSNTEVYDILNKKNDLTFYQRDIRDNLDDIFTRHQIDIVVHLAALKKVSESQHDPDLYYNVNVKGTGNLLDTMIKYGVKKLVFSSSACVYGNIPCPESGHKEDTILSLDHIPNNYGKTKLINERYLNDLASYYQDLQIVVLRFFNPLHHNNRLGTIECDNLFFIIENAISTNDVLTVFGNDYQTRDGTAIRDFISIEGLVNCFTKILGKLKDLEQGVSIYNVGTGNGVSILEIIKYCESYFKKKIKYQFGQRRDGDIPISYANVDKIKKELGWEYLL